MWFSMCRAKCTCVMIGMHCDRHVSSDLLISHDQHTFGSACVERDTQLACLMSLQKNWLKMAWVDLGKTNVET